MKNNIYYFLCVAGLCLSFTANAQEQRFNAGIVAGINLSQIDGDDLVGYNQLGANLGIRALTYLTDRWQVSLELLFSQKGSNASANDNPLSAFDKVRLNYVEVPVMINFLDWAQEGEDYSKVHFSTGLSYSRLINFTIEQFDGSDISDRVDYNPNAAMFLLGASFYFNKHIGIHARFSQSFTNIDNNQNNRALIGKTWTIQTLYMF